LPGLIKLVAIFNAKGGFNPEGEFNAEGAFIAEGAFNTDGAFNAECVRWLANHSDLSQNYRKMSPKEDLMVKTRIKGLVVRVTDMNYQGIVFKNIVPF